MRLSRQDQLILEQAYENVVLNELNRYEKESYAKRGGDPNERFKAFINFRKDYYYNQKDLLSDYKNQFKSKEYASKLNKVRLIRVIPSFAGVTSNKSGDIIFHRNESRKRVADEGHKLATARKTIHFAVNGIVGDHAFNTWENAGIVIIADPAHIHTKPQVTRLEDTWYLVDRNDELNIGKALVFVPDGVDIPEDMKNAEIKTYSGKPKDIVKSVLDREGIEMLFIGAHGAESNNSDFDGTKESSALFNKLGASNWDDDSNTPHSYSFASRIEYVMMTIREIEQFLKKYNMQLQDFTSDKITPEQSYEMQSISTSDAESIIKNIRRDANSIRQMLINNKKKDPNSRFQYSKQLQVINDFLKRAPKE